MGENPQSTVSSNWAVVVSDIRTVEVSNVSLAASDRDIKEFFSFSGEIEYVEMQSESEKSQVAYVTFKDSKGAHTAMLLSGATIVDRAVNVTPVENYRLPPGALLQASESKSLNTNSSVWKAEDMVTSMLAKGFVLGKDALSRAKTFDEQHRLLKSASATVASIDKKMGLSEKLSMGSALVNEKMREVDERFQVSEKTKSALSVAEQTASSAASALMSNQYVSTGASWMWNALSIVSKATEDLALMTKEKVEKAEEERKEYIYKERTGIVNNYAYVHLDDDHAVLSEGEPASVPINSSN